MRTRNNGRQNCSPFPVDSGYPPRDDIESRAMLPVFFLGMPAPQPLLRRRPHRGQLPDVDLSEEVIIERPSAMARLFALLRRIVRRRKSPPLVKPDTTA